MSEASPVASMASRSRLSVLGGANAGVQAVTVLSSFCREERRLAERARKPVLCGLPTRKMRAGRSSESC